jgi:hypothetical protein
MNERKVSQTTIKFIITYDMITRNKPHRIFLSHKSIDKPLVREFGDILRTLGFDPWIDEDDIKAGDKLHRRLLQGLKDSCAAIFFITENYVDDKYLATEIDHAITEATERGKDFRIITLVMREGQDVLKYVPQLLQQFVFKQPKSQLEALKEIINALPLKLGKPATNDA